MHNLATCKFAILRKVSYIILTSRISLDRNLALARKFTNWRSSRLVELSLAKAVSSVFSRHQYSYDGPNERRKSGRSTRTLPYLCTNDGLSPTTRSLRVRLERLTCLVRGSNFRPVPTLRADKVSLEEQGRGKHAEHLERE